MMSVGIIENIPLRQGGTRLDGHQNHSNKARRMRGRNTDNKLIIESEKTLEYQDKRRIILKLINEEKHVVFNSIGIDSRKKEIYCGVKVMVAI